jgi:hypothetical protein
MKKTSKELLFERMHYLGMPKKKLNEDEMGMDDIEATADDVENYDEAPSYQVKLDNICNDSRELHDKMEAFDDLPAWVQDKITIAEHNMKAIKDWIESKAHGNDSDEEPEMDTAEVEIGDEESSEKEDVKISDDDLSSLGESKIKK